MTNQKLPLPAILRQDAWAALKATWKTVLMLSAAIQLVNYALNQLVGVVPVVGPFLSILVTAAMMAPMMGVLSGVLGYYRGKPLPHACVKSMFPHWLQVMLYYLWLMLCIMGWMVLGMIPAVAGGVMMQLQGDAVSGIGALLMLGGIVLMVVLAFRAVLNYSMTQCILIDDPSTGVRDVLKKSKAMMHGYRWYYVRLSWPMVAITFAAMLLVSLLTSVLPLWLASMLSASASCFTGLFSYYFASLMYLALREEDRKTR